MIAVRGSRSAVRGPRSAVVREALQFPYDPAMSNPANPHRLHRGESPAWVRYVLSRLVYLFVPLTKLFPRRWPRQVSRSMTKILGRFGDYQPTEHDVLVCSYFKSGTNWTLHIAVQIAHRGRAEFEHIHDLVPWPDIPARSRYAVPATDDSARLASPTNLRVIKTHIALGGVPYAAKARYICVVRDPKDVFVSSYHFMRAMGLGPMMPSVAGWLDAYLSRHTALGSWAEHLDSYWRMRDRDNVLFLTYETMRTDLPGTVSKIATFMGVALTPAERDAVVAQTTFAHMKTIGHKFDAQGAPWTSTKGAMMRRGERGKSNELLSPAEQQRIDDYWRAELHRLGSDFPYDEAFALAPKPPADVIGAQPAPAAPPPFADPPDRKTPTLIPTE